MSEFTGHYPELPQLIRTSQERLGVNLNVAQTEQTILTFLNGYLPELKPLLKAYHWRKSTPILNRLSPLNLRTKMEEVEIAHGLRTLEELELKERDLCLFCWNSAGLNSSGVGDDLEIYPMHIDLAILNLKRPDGGEFTTFPVAAFEHLSDQMIIRSSSAQLQRFINKDTRILLPL